MLESFYGYFSNFKVSMKRLSDIDLLLLAVLCISFSIAIACRIKANYDNHSNNLFLLIKIV